jgi:hypothetical protein
MWTHRGTFTPNTMYFAVILLSTVPNKCIWRSLYWDWHQLAPPEISFEENQTRPNENWNKRTQRSPSVRLTLCSGVRVAWRTAVFRTSSAISVGICCIIRSPILACFISGSINGNFCLYPVNLWRFGNVTRNCDVTLTGSSGPHYEISFHEFYPGS